MRGKTYHRWTVIGDEFPSSNMVLCLCSCGTEREVNKKNLKAGLSKSCGCHRREFKRTHGMSRTKTYRAWQAINSRCFNPNGTGYKEWGGRGIRVCRRWRKSFEWFLHDMEEAPGPDYSIERKDNNGHYSCGNCKECQNEGWSANCKWATRSEQQRNKRTTRYYEFDGRSQCASAWAEEFGMTEKLFSSRLANGWSMERIRSQPVGVPRGPNAPKAEDRVLEFEGRSQTSGEWAAEFEIPFTVFLDRLHHRWPMERIRSQPARKRRC